MVGGPPTGQRHHCRLRKAYDRNLRRQKQAHNKEMQSLQENKNAEIKRLTKDKQKVNAKLKSLQESKSQKWSWTSWIGGKPGETNEWNNPKRKYSPYPYF